MAYYVTAEGVIHRWALYYPLHQAPSPGHLHQDIEGMTGLKGALKLYHILVPEVLENLCLQLDFIETLSLEFAFIDNLNGVFLAVHRRPAMYYLTE